LHFSELKLHFLHFLNIANLKLLNLQRVIFSEPI